MHRIVRTSLAAATLAAVAGGALAVPAFALSTTPAAPATPASPAKILRWEAVAGVTRTRTEANALVARLAGQGLRGFTVELASSHGKKVFEVDRTFATRAAAQVEVAALRVHHAGGSLEAETSTRDR